MWGSILFHKKNLRIRPSPNGLKMTLPLSYVSFVKYFIFQIFEL
jgi:hypothetical protein